MSATPPRPELLIGCPIYDRAWIMRHWFGHTEAACSYAGVEPHYVFVGDPRDEPTQSLIKEITTALGRPCYAVWIEEQPHRYVRMWTQHRYERMVYLRNTLLHAVRQIEPGLFLSLDSDILLAEEAIASMVQAMSHYGYDAVGGKAYMTPQGHGTWAPSFAFLGEGERLLRDENATLMTVDCIMAIKLMAPKAYNVDYELHHQGEDIGWSGRARATGCTLGWDGRVINKHVMSEPELPVLDPRVGF